MKIVKNEQGFVVSVTAIIIAVIIGLMVLYFSNSISLNVTSSSNNYSGSQAQWAAVSGAEYAIMKLFSGLDDIAGTYPFYNGNIIIDTLTTDPSNGTMQITSRGTHSSSNRIISITVRPTPADTLIDEGFENDDGFDYSPTGPGPGSGRYWGFTCDGEVPFGIIPHFVLTGADSCFFFGSKIQAGSDLTFTPMVATAGQDYMMTLSLAAGVDIGNVSKQSQFQTGDYLDIFINGTLLERWEGTSAGGGQPMTPRVGNAINALTTNFEDFTFNLTSIIGAVDTFRLSFEAKTNMSTKYIGIEGISLVGSGGYSVLTGGYTEI